MKLEISTKIFLHFKFFEKIVNTLNMASIPTFIQMTNKGAQWPVVECLTRDRGAAGLSLYGVTALWTLSKTHLS